MKGNTLQKLLDINSTNRINWPQEVFIQISESQVGRAIRTKKWKYSVVAPRRDDRWDGYLYSKSDFYNEEFLYNLDNDSYEKNNLVGDPEFVEIRNDMDEGDKETVSFDFIVPQGLEDGNYQLKLSAEYDYKNGNYREASDEDVTVILKVVFHMKQLKITEFII